METHPDTVGFSSWLGSFMKRNWKYFFIPLVLFFLTIFFFLPYLISDSIPYAADYSGSDLTELNLPLRFLSAQFLRQGQLPLWTDLLANGFPLLAEAQAGVFYPFNLIFFPLLPFVTAINFSFIINFFLASVFTYLYGRVLKISRQGSILAAIAFSFSGFFVFRIKHLNLINAAIWLPLEFYLVERYFLAKKKTLTVISLALIFAIQFFAGHPQISYICILTTFIYFIFRFYNFRKLGQKLLWPKVIILWLILGALTFGLVAIQFFPSYEFFQTSSRVGWAAYENVVKYSYHPRFILTFLNPYIFGNPAAASYLKDNAFGIFWENNVYLGIFPLLLAIYTFIAWWRRQPLMKVFLFILLFSFFVILGKYNPFLKVVLQILPGLKLFRFPQRFLLPVVLILSVAAGWGLDLFLSKLHQFSQNKDKLKNSKIFFSGIAIIIILITIIDLFFFGLNYLGVLPISYFNKTKSSEFLKQDSGLFRILSYNWADSWQRVYWLSDGWLTAPGLYLEHREVLPPNINVFYNIASADDRGWLEGGQADKELVNLHTLVSLQKDSINSESNAYVFSSQALKILGLENVKYILSFHNLEGEGLELKREIPQSFLPPLKIYQNSYFLPRAFAVFKEIVVGNDQEALARLLESDFEPKETILIEKDINQQENTTHKDGKVFINSWKPSIIDIDVNFSQSGFLFLSQVFYPGWRVKVDGVEKEILKANYAFSAVYLDAGKHQVIFYYQPRSFLAGETITFTTFGLIIILLIFQIREKHHDRKK